MFTKVQVFTVICAALMLAGCVRENSTTALKEIADLGPFEEFAEYNTVLENTEPGKRNIFVETPKLVVVIRPGLSKGELDRIAQAFVRANPRTEIDFFDSKLGLDNYVNLDSFDPRNGYKTDMTLDDNFKIKHLKATVRSVSGSFVINTDAFVPYGLAPKMSPSPQ